MKPRSVARATGPPCSGGAPDPIIEDAIRMGGRLRGGSLNVRPLSRLYDTIRRCRRLLNEARGRQDSVIQFSIPEVDSFKRIVRLAGRTLPGCDCTIADESINLSRFCKYCWRPTRNAVATVCGHPRPPGNMRPRRTPPATSKPRGCAPDSRVASAELPARMSGTFHTSEFEAALLV